MPQEHLHNLSLIFDFTVMVPEDSIKYSVPAIRCEYLYPHKPHKPQQELASYPGIKSIMFWLEEKFIDDLINQGLSNEK